jgi:NADPH:quinone reductase-like Zn-dependent oxidoreductase
MQTMRGVWLTGHGAPEKLEIRDDIPRPESGPGEVLIQVGAAGVNNTDINTRLAWYSKDDRASADAGWTGEPIRFPRIQGIDVCGEIVATGEGVDPARIGERVLVEPCLWEVGGRELDRPWFLGSECDGGFAEYVAVASRHAHAVHSGLGDVELASFPCSYSTAENLLQRCGLKAGERVLITGASGGVGSAAIQLATLRGAEVVAVTSPDKVEALRRLGVDRSVLRGESLPAVLGRDSVDVVVDLVAGPAFPALLDVLRPGGRYATSGAIAGPLVELDVRTLYLKDLSLFGCTVLDAGVFPALVGYIEQDRIRPLVDAVFPLEHIVEAQTRFMEKRHVGKLVLTVKNASY